VSGVVSQGRDRRVWLAVLAFAALAVQLFAVYAPGSVASQAEISIPNIDKAVHLLIFGIPTYLFARWTGRMWLVAAIFVLHGAWSEFIQGFIPGGDPDVFDFLADASGAVLAVVVLIVQKRWAKSKTAG